VGNHPPPHGKLFFHNRVVSSSPPNGDSETSRVFPIQCNLLSFFRAQGRPFSGLARITRCLRSIDDDGRFPSAEVYEIRQDPYFPFHKEESYSILVRPKDDSSAFPSSPRTFSPFHHLLSFFLTPLSTRCFARFGIVLCLSTPLPLKTDAPCRPR